MSDAPSKSSSRPKWLAKLSMSESGGEKIKPLGSAWLVANDVLVTCRHCLYERIAESREILVRFADDEAPTACVQRIQYSDEGTSDHALLYLDPKTTIGRIPLPIVVPPSDAIRTVANVAHAFGFPLQSERVAEYFDFQTTASISLDASLDKLQVTGGALEGMSGGPLVIGPDRTRLCIGMLTHGGRGRATTVLEAGGTLRKFLRAALAPHALPPRVVLRSGCIASIPDEERLAVNQGDNVREDNVDEDTWLVGWLESLGLLRRSAAINVSNDQLSRLLAPFQAPPVPAHFVPRPEVMAQLKARLIGRQMLTGTLVLGAIHGLGGIGKTTLAAAFSHDPETTQSFPDGVLWATLGQQPDVPSLLGDWIRALGDHTINLTTMDASSRHLQTLLQRKTMLLVLDDAWNAENVRPFLTSGHKCRILVTTRKPSVADDLNADTYQLDTMSPEDALELFSRRLNRRLEGAEKIQASIVAEDVGFLPLALELAVTRVKRGFETWETLHLALNKEVAQLERLDDSSRRHRGETRLQATFNLSLNALRDLDNSAWRVFPQLGLVFEDAALAAPMAATLFDVSVANAEEVLEVLWDHSLLSQASQVKISGRPWRSYRIHDLVRETASSILIRGNFAAGASQDAGGALALAHASLLERYRAKTTAGHWHTLTDDGYIHSHLAWHLEKSRNLSALDELFQEETQEGRNGWHQAREKLGQTTGYIHDINRVWGLVDTLPSSEQPTGHRLDCRFGLILSSLQSLSSNIAPTLLAHLVRFGLWSPEQALAHMRQIVDIHHQTASLCQLVSYLPTHFVGDALGICRKSSTVRLEHKPLIRLSEHLPADFKSEALSAALVIAETIADDMNRVKALMDVVPHLGEPHKARALRIAENHAKRIARESVRSNALAFVAVQLSSQEATELFQQAMTAAEAIPDDCEKAKTFASIATHLPKALGTAAMQNALDIARSNSERKDLWRALAYAPQFLSPKQRDEVIQHVQRDTRTDLHDYRGRCLDLLDFTEHLSAIPRKRAFRQALRFALRTSAGWNRDDTISSVVMAMAKAGSIKEAVKAAKHISYGRTQAMTLVWVAATATKSDGVQVLRKALKIAKELHDGDKEMAAVALGFAQAGATKEALSTTELISLKYNKAKSLIAIASLPGNEHLLESALRSAHALVSAYDGRFTRQRDEVLESVALSAAKAGQILQATSVANGITSPSLRNRLLVELAGDLERPERDQILRQGIQFAQDISDSVARCKVFASVAVWLPEPAKKQVFEKALQLAHSADADSQSLLAYVAEKLAISGELEWARDVVEKKISYYGRRSALLLVIAHFPEALQEKALEEEFTRSYSSEDLVAFSKAFARIGKTKRALRIALRIQDGTERARALIALAKIVPGSSRGKTEVLQHAFKSSLRLGRLAFGWLRDPDFDEHVRTMYLEDLANECARAGDVGLALNAALSIYSVDCQINALLSTADQLPKMQREQVLQRAMRLASRLRGKDRQNLALAKIIASIGNKDDVLRRIQNMPEDLGMIDVLVLLARNVSRPEREEILERALDFGRCISFVDYRDRALGSVADGFAKVGNGRKAFDTALLISSEYTRTKTFAMIAESLPKEIAEQALRSVNDCSNESERIKALRKLIPIVGVNSTILKSLLVGGANRSRPALLADLEVFIEWIAKINGHNAIADLVVAIEDVSRWWP